MRTLFFRNGKKCKEERKFRKWNLKSYRKLLQRF